MNTNNTPLRTFGKISRIALLAALVGATLLTGCGDKKGKGASQTAAKVNKEEITVHQINFVLQQQRGVPADKADVVSRQILERLIDQELAVQRAQELKLDRDPKVAQQVEAARREIIARAYLEQVGQAAAKPSADEVKKYYDDTPALFKDRRIYSLQELVVEARPDQIPTLRTKLAETKSASEFADYLKASDIRFNASQAVRAAEQLPMGSLSALSKLQDGQSMLVPTPTGAQVIFLASSRQQPVTLEQARPAIEQFLLNDRKRELATKDLKSLRDGAKIEYVGKFAEKAEAEASVPAASASTAAPVAPAASNGGLDAASINKGLGIK